MDILGVSCYYHDSASCLLRDGKLVAAVQEERFTRVKHDPRFPFKAVEYCLKTGQTDLDRVDRVVFYERPDHKWMRILDTYTRIAPYGWGQFQAAVQKWCGRHRPTRSLKDDLNIVADHMSSSPYAKPIEFVDHHTAHASSAFFPAPFEEAAVLTIDGVGESATTTYAVGTDDKLEMRKQINYPDSLGLLYSAFTYYIGFRVNSGEYKLMGLAPYGEPIYADLIERELLHLYKDGSFSLNQKYFDFFAGDRMVSQHFIDLFGGEARPPEGEITQRECDIAASIQSVTEKAVVNLASQLANVSGCANLCLAGGVALNCVANGILLRSGLFENIWIQPSAGDAGGAFGAALSVHHRQRLEELGESGGGGSAIMDHVFWGPGYSADEVEEFLLANGYPYTKHERGDLNNEVCELIAAEKVVGWFNGRMEYGPRALGNRSIIADPRSPKM
jgi:carbamoyltransferase